MRERERAFVVEGPRLIADALSAGARPQMLYYAPSRCGPLEARIVERVQELGVRLVPISEEVLEYIAETVTPQAVLAVFPMPRLPFRLPEREHALLLLLDRLQDPGNLGTLLRSALGAGAHAVLLMPGTVDPYNPKVVRAAAGAHFRLPIQELTPDGLHEVGRSVVQWVVADPRARLSYDDVDWTAPSLLAIGSEAHGTSEIVERVATHRVAIPLRGGLESLNAAVAGSIILFEAARQRRNASRQATTRE
ncbi:RNA methyltransferase [Thermomicrobium sp. 4228-Ro]|nr:RNA methyltransferase [Thermomicrobium sp. 4228-Ro]MCX2726088.1 RNA methyltransferase [Thermomicrobium sp. 4228-Ro]